MSANRSSRVYEAAGIKTAVLSPARFIALTSAERANIERATIVVPTLGRAGFGGVRVTYRDPLYRVVGAVKG